MDCVMKFVLNWLVLLRKSKGYVYSIWVYKVLGIWKFYYRVKKITSFMHKTVNRGKKCDEMSNYWTGQWDMIRYLIFHEQNLQNTHNFAYVISNSYKGEIVIFWSSLQSLQWRHNERLISPAFLLFTQPFVRLIREITKSPRHWPLWGEFTGDQWIPRTKILSRGKCFHLMTSLWMKFVPRGVIDNKPV